MGGSSEHVHYGATTLPRMRASCLPEHTLQAASSFRVTHNAEGPDQPRVQRPHTHTLIDTVSPPLLPTGAAHLVAANTEDAVSSLSRSLESNTEATTREYIEYQHRVLHHELTFCVQISITQPRSHCKQSPGHLTLEPVAPIGVKTESKNHTRFARKSNQDFQA